MEDWGVILFGAIGLAFLLLAASEIETLRRRARRQGSIHRRVLRRTTRQLLVYSLGAWLAYVLLFAALYYIVGEGQQAEQLPFTLLICLIGPLIFTFSALGGTLLVLRNIFGIRVIDDTNESETATTLEE